MADSLSFRRTDAALVWETRPTCPGQQKNLNSFTTDPVM
jgi:hypothetical protein